MISIKLCRMALTHKRLLAMLSFMHNRGITQRELARILGLTQKSISQALNGKGGLAPETRKRVIDAASELGYRVNGMARRIQEGRYRGMALLGGATRPAYNVSHVSFFRGAEAALRARGWHLTVTWLPEGGIASSGDIDDLMDLLLADVVLVHDLWMHASGVAELLDGHRVPRVWVSTDRPLDAVAFDDRKAGEDAALHLAAQGYRYPAMLLHAAIEDPGHHVSARERWIGFAAGCALAGVVPRVVHPPSGEGSVLAVGRALRSVLQGGSPPDAILAYSGDLLQLARVVLAECGLRLGVDAGLMGFAASDEMAFDPSLTVCQLDFEGLGFAAVEAGWDRLANGSGRPARLVGVPLRNQGASTSKG